MSAPEPTIRGQRVDPRALGDDDLAAWGRLADRAAEPNPFYRPQFLVPALVERGRSARLLVVRRGDEWLACLPVQRVAPTRRLPVPTLAALTDEYLFSGTPLLDGDALDIAAAGLLALIRAERRAAAVLIGTWEPDGPVGQALDRAAARRGRALPRAGRFVRAGWRRADQPHFPGPAFDRADRKELARRTRLLTKEIGAPEVVDRSADPDAVERFLAIENSGWKADHGNPLASLPGDAAFFRRMCREMASIGRLEIVALESAGRTLAMECHLVDGRRFWSFKIGYDPELRKFGPGTILKARVIEGLETRPIDLADSCAVADNAHMNRLWPDRRVMEMQFIPTGSPGWWIVLGLLRARGVARWGLARLRRRGGPPGSGPADDPA